MGKRVLRIPSQRLLNCQPGFRTSPKSCESCGSQVFTGFVFRICFQSLLSRLEDIFPTLTGRFNGSQCGKVVGVPRRQPQRFTDGFTSFPQAIAFQHDSRQRIVSGRVLGVMKNRLLSLLCRCLPGFALNKTQSQQSMSVTMR